MKRNKNKQKNKQNFKEKQNNDNNSHYEQRIMAIFIPTILFDNIYGNGSEKKI